MNTILNTTGMLLASIFLHLPQASALPPQLPPPPEVAPTDPELIDPFDGTLHAGYQETLLLNQCFNFVDGSVTACYHQHADFKYTYSTVQGANILPRHDFRLGESMENMPSFETCQSADMYDLTLQLSLPMENSAGRYYCFETEYNGDTVYGWFQPTSFNNSGITFNYRTYEAMESTLVYAADPEPNIRVFYQIHETWRTMLDGQCYNFSEGQVVSCWTGEPDFRYNYVDIYGGIIESRPAAAFSTSITSTPSKITCQQASYLEETAVTFENNPPGIYVCFQTEMNGEDVYGWLHPTNFNEGGMTFDYAIFTP